MPQRWLVDRACFTAAALPERFFVVAEQTDEVRAAVQATLPRALERFRVGDTYEVSVYRTAEAPLAWLELPVPDGELATFPLRLGATHLQLLRERAAAQGAELVATGEPGVVVRGPYIALPRGRYVARWIGRALGGAGQLSFAVTRAGQPLAPALVRPAHELPAQPAELARVSFTLGRARGDIELPVESAGGGRVALHEIVIDRAP